MAEEPPTWVSWQDYVDGHMDLLRRELDRSVDAFRDQMQERFAAQERAVAASADANQRALEKVNEFRQALTDQNQRFATFDTVKVIETRLSSMDQDTARRLSALETGAANLSGKAEQAVSSSRTSMAIAGVVLLVVQIALHVFWK